MFLAEMAGDWDYEAIADDIPVDVFHQWHAYRLLREENHQHDIATLYAMFHNLTITLVSCQPGGEGVKESDLKSADDFLSGASAPRASVTHEESAKRAAARYGK